MPLSFDVTREDAAVITMIAARAFRLYYQTSGAAMPRGAIVDIMMDVEATHASGNRLDLVRLLAADDANFLHDITGIRNHLDRATGELRDCFVPRFTRRSLYAMERV